MLAVSKSSWAKPVKFVARRKKLKVRAGIHMFVFCALLLTLGAGVNDSEAQPYNIDDVRLHRLEICTVWFYGIERAVNEQALTNAETSSSLKRLYV